ncbi:MAG TPA: insulinase family protein, partial [Rhizomicrobium sp.]|nr:insulinase family protein [Rhizomicrobium sp.]
MEAGGTICSTGSSFFQGIPTLFNRETASRCILAAFLVVAGSAAQAATQKVSQFALPNGMQVVVIPDHRAPVVTQMIWFRVGAMDDPQGLSGLAHFFEHMMFRGTKSVPGDQ